MQKITTTSLLKMKQEGSKIAMLTCYDYQTSVIMNEAGIDVLLVGDSLGMVILGYENTLPVTMDEMIHHTKAVKRGNSRALIIADMPYLSYQLKKRDAVKNAGRFIKEGGAEAVKVEGGKEMVKMIKAILNAGIPVMGHIGLMPQAVNKTGGYKVQGRLEADSKKLLEDAKALEKAGVFSIVLESIPKDLARKITESVSVPTISCGAGKYCDGQVLVVNDMLGLYKKLTPKFVKQYADLYSVMKKAFEDFKQDVEQGSFPDEEHSY
ncbi:MAG: 3-methyl-2-oxobutanoate hydroxymethyltransferase [bacterium]